MFELECCLALSSHEVRWLKVSRLRAHRRPHERERTVRKATWYRGAPGSVRLYKRVPTL